jgi:hypothetical protein
VITEAAGFSKGYASQIRAGKWPNVAVWPALAELAKLADSCRC